MRKVTLTEVAEKYRISKNTLLKRINTIGGFPEPVGMKYRSGAGAPSKLYYEDAVDDYMESKPIKPHNKALEPAFGKTPRAEWFTISVAEREKICSEFNSMAIEFLTMPRVMF